MFEASFGRPKDFFELSPQEQWDIDKNLDILDWDGGCQHNKNELCNACRVRFNEHYGR